MPTPINISASRGAAILGLSKWKTPIHAWLEMMKSRQTGFCEKHGYQIPEFEYNSAMKWGHAFESAIIELAENVSGDKIIDREDYYYRLSEDFITCHIDGKYKKTPLVHEGKTTSAHNFYESFGEPGTDQVPMEYQIQCQHQLICTGAEQVILSVLVFPKRVEEWEKEGWIIQQHENPDYYFLFNEKEQRATTPENWARILSDMGYFHQYIITPHAELQNLMISAYTDFWNENILGGKSPEPKEYNDIRMLCREPVGTIVATAEVEYLMSELKNIKSEISGTGTLAKRADMIKMSVCDYMRHEKGVEDLESKDKWILRGQDGKKLAQYSKDKNGNMIFR